MSVRIIQGDVRDELPKLAADSFDCIVTSPPYYGLRDYNCEGQIGLEPTLDAYLETMVAVCRELRRVLKPSGVFFLNIGDSYCSTDKWGGGGNVGKQTIANDGSVPSWYVRKRKEKQSCLKPKDLCLVPERLGIALQADGWWVRSRIVWAKLNPMPESVTDRPTSAHETIWMLTKSARYFWDGDAVREEACEASIARISQPNFANQTGGEKDYRNGVNPSRSMRKTLDNFAENPGRNLRNVWTIATHPFPGAHFATFPPALVERCIKAGSSECGCCSACGAPWERVIERGQMEPQRKGEWKSTGQGFRNDIERKGGFHTEYKNLGWQSSCKCGFYESLRNLTEFDCDPDNPKQIPSRILDPFAGSGTVGLVADRLGRDCTLIDLNTSYIDMAVNRIRDDSPLFAEVAAE